MESSKKYNENQYLHDIVYSLRISDNLAIVQQREWVLDYNNKLQCSLQKICHPLTFCLTHRISSHVGFST